MKTTKKTGQKGEEIATEFLRKKGYQILDRNCVFKILGSFQKGELDIVAKKSDVFCFVEVKTIKNPKIEILPEEKVNFSKKKKLILSAQSWLLKNKFPLDSKWRIDIISIILRKGQEPEIFHFENAISDFS